MNLRSCLLLPLFIALFLSGCGSGLAPDATSAAVPITPEPTAFSTVSPETAGPEPGMGQSGCPVTRAGSASESATLTLGPSSGIQAPAQPETPEAPLIIAGTVYDESCVPLANASLHVWQTNSDGEYGPGHGSEDLECCYLQGTVRTDPGGHFQLVTVRPGHYKGQSPPPPAHIHVELRHPDIRSLQAEIVFADDPYLPPGAQQPGLIVVTLAIEPTLSALFGVADIVVERVSPAGSAGEASTVGAVGNVRTFDVVPDASEAAYHIREKFAELASNTTAVGETHLLQGTLTIRLDRPPTLQALTLTADLRGLRTDEPQRDEKLAERWLVTNKFPFASFSATGIRNGPVSYREGDEVTFILDGEMSIRDLTRPVAFDVTAVLADNTVTGSATASILMTDFGIDPPNLFDFVKVEDEVVITVKLTARESGSGP